MIKMSNKKSKISLKIKKLTGSKFAGRGIIRIDHNIMDEFNFKIGDLIEILNPTKKKNAAAHLFPSIAEDTGKEIVRVDQSTRRNLDAKQDDIITIRKVEAVYANKITLAALDQAVILRNVSQLAKLLENRAVTKEDILSFAAKDRRLDFIILDFEPNNDVLLIKEDTEIIIVQKSYKEMTFDPKSIIPDLQMISQIYEEISIRALESKIDTPGEILPILEDMILNGTIKARIKRDYVVFNNEYESDEDYKKKIEKEGIDVESIRKKRKVQEISVIDVIFELSEKVVDPKLVSVMMPFNEEFNGVYQMLKSSCDSLDLTCKRADEIWKYDIIIQDLIDLIYCSSAVIIDLTDKNPNVFYETGIAHTLKKNVILITQHDEDIPFDLRLIRYLKYNNTIEGLEELGRKIKKRLGSVINNKN